LKGGVPGTHGHGEARGEVGVSVVGVDQVRVDNGHHKVGHQIGVDISVGGGKHRVGVLGYEYQLGG
jgi:hypothetical protein